MVEGKCHVIGIDDDSYATADYARLFFGEERGGSPVQLTLQDNKTMMKDHKNEARQISIDAAGGEGE